MLKINKKNFLSVNFRRINIHKVNNFSFFILNNKIDLLNKKYLHLSNFYKMNLGFFFKANCYLYLFEFDYILKYIKRFLNLKIEDLELDDFIEIIVLNNFMLNLNFSNLQQYYKLFDVSKFGILFFSIINFVFIYIIFIIYFILNTISYLLCYK